MYHELSDGYLYNGSSQALGSSGKTQRPDGVPPVPNCSTVAMRGYAGRSTLVHQGSLRGRTCALCGDSEIETAVEAGRSLVGSTT